jgi:hypothetical protein
MQQPDTTEMLDGILSREHPDICQHLMPQQQHCCSVDVCHVWSKASLRGRPVPAPSGRDEVSFDRR